jgi:hypothetical protein
MLAGGAYAIGSSSGRKSGQQSQYAAEQDQRLHDLETQRAVETALANQQAAQQAAAQQAAMMQQMQQQQQAAVPQAAPALSQGDKIAKLRELGSLRDAGVLNEEEFASEKQKILAL